MTDQKKPYELLLETDGWRPLSEYKPSGGDYVYVKGFGFNLWHPAAGIARGGKYATSFWYDPSGRPLMFDVQEWKPFPDDGVSPHERWKAFCVDPNDNSYVRPPEPVYEPCGTSTKLTPGAADMLRALRNGAVLHERAWRWTEWRIGAPGMPPVRINERNINALRKVSFIARDGVLPPGRIPEWLEFEWKITPAGQAWLDVHAKPAASAAQPQETT
jgi:hypothetical protein